jgi:hypothetical protein
VSDIEREMLKLKRQRQELAALLADTDIGTEKDAKRIATRL